jgi:hypothetical protein
MNIICLARFQHGSHRGSYFVWLWTIFRQLNGSPLSVASITIWSHRKDCLPAFQLGSFVSFHMCSRVIPQSHTIPRVIQTFNKSTLHAINNVYPKQTAMEINSRKNGFLIHVSQSLWIISQMWLVGLFRGTNHQRLNTMTWFGEIGTRFHLIGM